MPLYGGTSGCIKEMIAVLRYPDLKKCKDAFVDSTAGFV